MEYVAVVLCGSNIGHVLINDTVGGGTGDLQACQTAIDTRCSASGASSVEVPSTCVTTDANGNREIIQGAEGSITGVPGDSTFSASCN